MEKLIYSVEPEENHECLGDILEDSFRPIIPKETKPSIDNLKLAHIRKELQLFSNQENDTPPTKQSTPQPTKPPPVIILLDHIPRHQELNFNTNPINTIRKIVGLKRVVIFGEEFPEDYSDKYDVHILPEKEEGIIRLNAAWADQENRETKKYANVMDELLGQGMTKMIITKEMKVDHVDWQDEDLNRVKSIIKHLHLPITPDEMKWAIKGIITSSTYLPILNFAIPSRVERFFSDINIQLPSDSLGLVTNLLFLSSLIIFPAVNEFTYDILKGTSNNLILPMRMHRILLAHAYISLYPKSIVQTK